MEKDKEINEIYFDGKIYDAYSKILDIFSSARNELIVNNTFHDRFIIIDKKILYHSGASFKDLGKKCFEISKIDEKDILEKLIKMISQ